MIDDQRHMFNVSDVAEVNELWDGWLLAHGLDRVKDKRTVNAYINHSRWVADCPNCNDGIACWPDNPTGCCLGCGHEYKVTFPAPKTRAAIEQTLGERSKSVNRHWKPGEKLEELKAETVLLEGVL